MNSIKNADVVNMEELDMIKQIFNLPYEGAIFVDQQGIIRLVNDTLCTYLDLTHKQLIGHSIDEFKFDPNLMNVVKTGRPDLLAFYPHNKVLATRQPVIADNTIIGVVARYEVFDLTCVKKNLVDFDDYMNIISRLNTRDILQNVAKFMHELKSYQDEFNLEPVTGSSQEIIKGMSPIIKALRETILWIGSSPSSVLISGESGTGKELFAQSIHYSGARVERPFVKVNCAAIPEPLLESELFGYVEGAFTGARKGGKIGKFEQANGGTIFLDEIGDMALAMQAKLLRVLQEREIERIGDDHTIPIDVRVISATNKDLKWMINQGTFRPDLYYRLNVVNLYIPPLRERTEDIPILAQYYLEQLNRKLGLKIQSIEDDAMRVLLQYNWPGNIRELINVLETSMNFCRHSTLTSDTLPLFLHKQSVNEAPADYDLKSGKAAAEKERISMALNRSYGNRQQAAAILGISRTTLYRLMKKYQIE